MTVYPFTRGLCSRELKQVPIRSVLYPKNFRYVIRISYREIISVSRGRFVQHFVGTKYDVILACFWLFWICSFAAITPSHRLQHIQEWVAKFSVEESEQKGVDCWETWLNSWQNCLNSHPSEKLGQIIHVQVFLDPEISNYQYYSL